MRALLLLALVACSEGLTAWDVEGQWTLGRPDGPPYFILVRRVDGSCELAMSTFAGNACASISDGKIHTGGRLCLSAGCTALIPTDTDFVRIDDDHFMGKVQEGGVISPAILQRRHLTP